MFIDRGASFERPITAPLTRGHNPERAIVSLWVITLFAIGCRDGVGPSQPQHPRVQPEWVVGEAAAALDEATGLFTLPITIQRRVSQLTAESLATAAARLLGNPALSGNAAAILERDRGGPIAFQRILPCHRRIYVHSAFLDLPSEVPSSLRRSLAPQWGIALCGPDGAAQLSIGVPDDTMDVRLIDGTIVYPSTGSGNDFTAVGVPYRYPWGLPLSPEGAVAHAVAMTGQRVALVPAAFNQRDADGFGQLALCASWLVVFESPAPLVDVISGELLQLTEVYVRHSPTCFSDAVAMYYAPAIQPATRWLQLPSTDGGAADSVEVNVSGPLLFRGVRASGGLSSYLRSSSTQAQAQREYMP